MSVGAGQLRLCPVMNNQSHLTHGGGVVGGEGGGSGGGPWLDYSTEVRRKEVQ